MQITITYGQSSVGYQGAVQGMGYGPGGYPTPLRYCKHLCQQDPYCRGFFYQKHHSGTEVCGGYRDGVSPTSGYPIGNHPIGSWHNHAAGAVCGRENDGYFTSNNDD